MVLARQEIVTPEKVGLSWPFLAFLNEDGPRQISHLGGMASAALRHLRPLLRRVSARLLAVWYALRVATRLLPRPTAIGHTAKAYDTGAGYLSYPGVSSIRTATVAKQL